MDTKSFTKHWNYEIVHQNLLTDWHDALVGISPCTTQPITTNRHLCRRTSSHFFVQSLFLVYPTNIAGVTFGELFRGQPEICCC